MDGKGRAVIDPNILSLSQIVQDGRHGIVNLDLLNFKEAPLVDSLTHPSIKMMSAQLLQRHRPDIVPPFSCFTVTA